MNLRTMIQRPTSLLYLISHAIVFVIGVILSFLHNEYAKAVGISFVAAGAAGWLLFAYVYLTERTRERIDVMTEMGFVDAFPARSAAIKQEYDKRVDTAKRNIDIMGFGLRTLKEDYGKDFADWKTHAHVRILLLDPDFPSAGCSYADQRDIEEDQDQGSIRRDVTSFLAATRGVLHKSESGSFEVRLYRSLPSVNIFRVDDEMFWGPYLLGQPSRNLPTFVVSKNGALFPRLLAHFDALWTSSVTPPLGGQDQVHDQ